MIDVLIAVVGFVAGLLAHQTDRVVKTFPPDWELLSRYGIGYLTTASVFALMIRRLNKFALRDGLLCYLLAGFTVGLGVVTGRLIDDQRQGG